MPISDGAVSRMIPGRQPGGKGRAGPVAASTKKRIGVLRFLQRVLSGHSKRSIPRKRGQKRSEIA